MVSTEIEFGLADTWTEILIVTDAGYGKRTKLEEYRFQSRGAVSFFDRFHADLARLISGSVNSNGTIPIRNAESCSCLDRINVIDHFF